MCSPNRLVGFSVLVGVMTLPASSGFASSGSSFVSSRGHVLRGFFSPQLLRRASPWISLDQKQRPRTWSRTMVSMSQEDMMARYPQNSHYKEHRQYQKPPQEASMFNVLNRAQMVTIHAQPISCGRSDIQDLLVYTWPFCFLYLSFER